MPSAYSQLARPTNLLSKVYPGSILTPNAPDESSGVLAPDDVGPADSAAPSRIAVAADATDVGGVADAASSDGAGSTAEVDAVDSAAKPVIGGVAVRGEMFRDDEVDDRRALPKNNKRKQNKVETVV